jgi:glutaredoxin/glutathione-dependent peroxiredoxin
MTIKVGDRLPAGVLWEFIEEETPGCTVGPNSFKVEELVRGKRIAVFGLPGAFTPTCSAKHLPGFVSHADKLKSAKVDEIWCLSVNDAFVMGARVGNGSDGAWPRGTLPALFHAGPGWGGEDS